MKKITALALSLFMLCSLVSCSGESLPASTEATSSVTVSETTAETTDTTPTVSETEASTTTPVTDVTDESTKTEEPEMTAEKETTVSSAATETDAPTAQTTVQTTQAAETTIAITTTASVTTTAEVTTVMEPQQEKNLFVHAEGAGLVDGNGRPFRIKGMAFGNNVWGNPSSPVNGHHTEESYKLLSELGFNSIRFYINYGLFEDDAAPYKYKQAGFDYLDKNIEWAKKYNIKLILNMHYPQGGYQSQGEGMELWTNSENQRRLAKLWGEIARRYADEPAIIGFGLVNEPYLAKLSSDEASINQWKKLAQDITDEIRLHDKNHVVFIERILGIKDPATGVTDWKDFTGENNLFLINDDNAVYEFHYYSPHPFTHQNAGWAGTEGQTCSYPNGIYAQAKGEQWYDYVPRDIYADPADNEWQYFNSGKQSVPSGAKLATPCFSASRLGAGGTACRFVNDLLHIF